MQSYESGLLDVKEKTIELDVNNLKGLTYDLISEAFTEVLLQAGIDPKQVFWQEWKLTCKYFDSEEEGQNA